MRIAAIAAAAALLCAGACDEVTEPGEREVLGFVVGFHEEDPDITVPPRVSAGVPFTVRVRTYGPSGCWRQGDTDALRVGATISLFPFDRVAEGDACTAVVTAFDHTAEVTLDAPGDARVVVRGRENGSGDVVSFEFPVVVDELVSLRATEEMP